MKYFKNVKKLENLKNQFRRLVMELHPDKGGSQTDFIQMYEEFERLKIRLENGQMNSNKEFKQTAEDIYNLIRKFDKLVNVRIEFVGNWVWLTDEEQGATYQQREEIKSIRLKGYNTARFARKKGAWYFSPEGYRKKSKKSFSLDEIKNNFGVQGSYVNKKKFIQ